MKILKLFIIGSVALFIGMTLAACASMTLVSVDMVEGPRQVRQGDDIDPKSVTVWGLYKDGSRKVVNISSSDITFNKHNPGLQTVRVRVRSQAGSFQTEVMALHSLTIASQPRTTLFKVGQEADRTWPGLEVRGEWDQMGSQRIATASCEITGYARDQVGIQTIRVSYEGITTTFDVELRAMTSLQIAQAPTKLDYAQGEALNLAGLRVTGVWEGFPPENLAITINDITGYNMDNTGIQRVTVTKNGKSATFNVEVLTLVSIIIDQPPAKTDYTLGERLDLTGLIVNGNYTGTVATKRMTQSIPLNQLNVSGYDPNTVGRQQRVTVTVRGQSANFFVNVDASATQMPGVQPPLDTDGTFNVSNSAAWNTAVNAIKGGSNNKNYLINITANFTVEGQTTPTFGSVTGTRVILQGPGRTATLASAGNILRIGAGQTVILGDLALNGGTGNSNNLRGDSLVYVDSGGTFTMQGGEISGNLNGSINQTGALGGGVHVAANGTFTMQGGKISGNTVTATSSARGGGVYVAANGSFIMQGGEISGNTGSTGGGVSVVQNGSFTMQGGKISGNKATTGGGVHVVENGTFTMMGGEISGNTASFTGGGIAVSGTFRIVTGTIYGSNESTASLRNTASEGAALRIYGTAQRGMLNGSTWTRTNDLVTTDNTVRVVNANQL